MADIATLRARALDFAASQRLRYRLPLDPDVKARLAEAEARVAQATEALAEARQGVKDGEPIRRRLSEAGPVKDLEQAVVDAEAHLSEMEAVADRDSLVAVWRRLTGREFRDLRAPFWSAKEQRWTDGGEGFEAFAEALLTETFVGVETTTGEAVDLSLDELRDAMLNSGDEEIIKLGLVDLNRGALVTPFRPAKSGRPATS